MRPEELDDARMREAIRQMPEFFTPGVNQEQIARLAARLAREGWMPVDPLLVEARELVAQWYDAAYFSTHTGGYLGAAPIASRIRSGRQDDAQVQITLKAIQRGIELGRAENV